MDKTRERDLCIATAENIKHQRIELEERLETCRRHSRDLALRLLIEFKLPVLRVSRITGHMRQTLMTWVESELAKGEESLFWPFPESDD